MRGVVFAAALMLILVGVDLINIAPGWWFLVGDLLLGVGVCVLSAIVDNTVE